MAFKKKLGAAIRETLLARQSLWSSFLILLTGATRRKRMRECCVLQPANILKQSCPKIMFSNRLSQRRPRHLHRTQRGPGRKMKILPIVPIIQNVTVSATCSALCLYSSSACVMKIGWSPCDALRGHVVLSSLCVVYHHYRMMSVNIKRRVGPHGCLPYTC